MEMKQYVMPSDLSGRVANTSLPLSNGLLPLFEAVINSIHSIGNRYSNSEKGEINIHIIREDDNQEELLKSGRPSLSKIVNFIVTDDGEGFNKENMDAFATLDTRHKKDIGGRGIGRLMWLKAFENVRIESVFEEGGHRNFRKFNFNIENVVELLEDSNDINMPIQTSIHLNGFKDKYRQSSHKQGLSIARDILEHCMWYFLREGGVGDIKVKDGDEVYDLHKIYSEGIKTDLHSEDFEIEGVRFSISHLKIRNDFSDDPGIVLCANNRVVKELKFSQHLSWANKKLKDDDGDFVYKCFVTSNYLDASVRGDRLDFDFDGDLGELFEAVSLTQESIVSEIESRVETYLESEKASMQHASEKRIREYVDHVSPRYKPIMNRLSDTIITPDISDKDLEIVLHKEYAKVEEEILQESEKLFSEIDSLNQVDASDKLQKFMHKVETVKSSELTAYVFYRRYALQVLSLLLKRDTDGKYAKEEAVHNLIFPMGQTSESISMHASNLWIIDERLAFHSYLGSDKTFSSMPIIDSDSTEQPDILSCKTWITADSLSDNNMNDIPLLVGLDNEFSPHHSLSVVEFKRPMRDDYKPDNNPIEQVLKYFDKIRSGKMKDYAGRPIIADKVPLFGYIIADITPKLEDQCKLAELMRTPDGNGFFGYKSSYQAYLEVISFDKLLRAAYERNQIFFEKLGINIKSSGLPQ